MKNFFKFYIIFIFLFFNFLFLNFKNIYALQIKNINYSANNNNDRWVELYNDGEDILDFTDSSFFKIYTSKSTVQTGHSINELIGGKNIPANSTFYLTASNPPANTTKAFKSNYSLDKTNGFFSIINTDRTGQYVCQSYGTSTCSSLPLISVNINNQNLSTSTNPNTSTTTNSTTTIENLNIATNTNQYFYSTQYIYIEKNSQEKYGDIKILFPENKIITAGVENDFSLKVVDSKNQDITKNLDFHFSFGDGGEKFGKDVRYIYFYPGEYNLVASADGYSSGGKVFSKIKVLEPLIKILKIGDINKNENWIEIENQGEEDIYLSNFYLKINNDYFKLAKNFFINKKSKIKLAGENIGFNLASSTNFLLNSSQNINWNDNSSTSSFKILNISLHYPNPSKKILNTFDYLLTTDNLLKNFSNTSPIISTTSIFITNTTTSTSSLNLEKPKIKKFYFIDPKENQKPVENYLFFDEEKINNLNLNKTLNNDKTFINQQEKDEFSLKEDLQNYPENPKKEKQDIGIIKWLKNVLYFK